MASSVGAGAVRSGGGHRELQLALVPVVAELAAACAAHGLTAGRDLVIEGKVAKAPFMKGGEGDKEPGYVRVVKVLSEQQARGELACRSAAMPRREVTEHRDARAWC